MEPDKLKSKILVIDDEAPIRKMLTFVFKEYGYQDIVSAQDFDSAYALISKTDFDVIFCDIMLGTKTGLDLLEKLKENEITCPVVLITGQPNTDTAIMALRLGAFDYLRKPIIGSELIKIADKALKYKADLDEKKLVNTQTRHPIDDKIRSYQEHIEHLRGQIDSAADIYQNLVELQHTKFKLNMAWKHRPVARLGGDFIDIREKESRACLLIADVAGHDMGSSYHTVLLKAFFEENCYQGNDGLTLFRLINHHLLGSVNEKRMITGAVIHIDREKQFAEITSAAHPWILFMDHQFQIPKPMFEKGGHVLGMYEHAEFEYRKVQTSPGDRLFAFTDGVIDVTRFDIESGDRVRLGNAGLCDLLVKHRDLSIVEQIAEVWKDVLVFCKKKPLDDMLLFGLEF